MRAGARAAKKAGQERQNGPSPWPESVLTGWARPPMVRRPLGARSSGVEHLTFNQRVDGSIPSGLTNQCQGPIPAIISSISLKTPSRTPIPRMIYAIFLSAFVLAYFAGRL